MGEEGGKEEEKNKKREGRKGEKDVKEGRRGWEEPQSCLWIFPP